jgi:hypothetical protein
MKLNLKGASFPRRGGHGRDTDAELGTFLPEFKDDFQHDAFNNINQQLN